MCSMDLLRAGPVMQGYSDAAPSRCAVSSHAHDIRLWPLMSDVARCDRYACQGLALQGDTSTCLCYQLPISRAEHAT